MEDWNRHLNERSRDDRNEVAFQKSREHVAQLLMDPLPARKKNSLSYDSQP